MIHCVATGWRDQIIPSFIARQIGVCFPILAAVSVLKWRISSTSAVCEEQQFNPVANAPHQVSLPTPDRLPFPSDRTIRLRSSPRYLVPMVRKMQGGVGLLLSVLARFPLSPEFEARCALPHPLIVLKRHPGWRVIIDCREITPTSKNNQNNAWSFLPSHRISMEWNTWSGVRFCAITLGLLSRSRLTRATLSLAFPLKVTVDRRKVDRRKDIITN